MRVYSSGKVSTRFSQLKTRRSERAHCLWNCSTRGKQTAYFPRGGLAELENTKKKN